MPWWCSVIEADAVNASTKTANSDKINQLQEITARCWRHIRNLALTLVSTEGNITLLHSSIAVPVPFSLVLDPALSCYCVSWQACCRLAFLVNCYLLFHRRCCCCCNNRRMNVRPKRCCTFFSNHLRNFTIMLYYLVQMLEMATLFIVWLVWQSYIHWRRPRNDGQFLMLVINARCWRLH